MYKKIISPFLFLFDPEKIHTFTFFLIKVFFKIPILGFIIESFYKVESPKLTRKLFGLTFENPVGIAAGFDKKVHDFGTIMDGEAQETVFSYTNTGEAPLVITEIKSTCGCTVPQDWSRAPLLPGESSQFTVKFNGKGMNKTSKTVTIKANTQRGTESVRISAFINKLGGVAPPAGPVIQ